MLNRVLDVFTRNGAQHIDPDILQPADLLLNVYGEDLRGRAFVVNDYQVENFCLRPDFTVPIARAYLAGNKARMYCYAGPVFRRDKTNAKLPREKIQAGIEVYQNGADADAHALRGCLDALEQAGATDVKIRIGDLNILFAILEAMDMPTAIRNRLKRHVWRPTYFIKLLEGLNQTTGQNDLQKQAFFKSFGRMDYPSAELAVQHILSLSNTVHQGTRSTADIAARFVALSREADHRPLDKVYVEVIKKFMAINCPAEEAVDRIALLTRDAGLDIRQPLENFMHRLQLIGRACRFSAHFGRSLEYYDGFVFDCEVRKQIVAGGGRYDKLFERLGSTEPVYAVGGAVHATDLEELLV